MSIEKYNYSSLLKAADKGGVDAAVNIIACELGFIGLHFIAQLIYKREFNSYVQLVNILQMTLIEEKTPNGCRIYADKLLDCFIRIDALSKLNLLKTNLK